MARKTRAPARKKGVRKTAPKAPLSRRIRPLGPRFRGDERSSGAPARKLKPPRTAAKKAGAPRPFYTPEFLAEARRRIEHTTESMTSIAGKFGMHHSVLSKLIQREGWLRPEGSLRRRGLSPAMRLAAQADALAAAPSPPDPAALDRIEQAVLKELETVETMRASLDKEPLRPIDAERTARTLSIHAETLAKLRRHRLAAVAPAGADHDDDFPADLDAFRDELARRIRAFIASRTAGSDAERAGAAARVAEVR